MLFYKFQVTCEFKSPKNASNSFENSRAFKFQLGELSGALSEGIDGDKVRVLIHRSRQNVFQMLVAVNGFQELTAAKLTRLLEKFFADHDEFGVKGVKIKDLQEITTTKFSKIFDRANRSENFNFDYYQINQDLGLDALENRTFKLTEIICPVKRLPFETAKKDAQNLLADETFKEEFERIYSKENVHHFYGQPVHYKIIAGNTSAALSLSNLLVATLYTNKRLVSRRINIITNVTDNCYDETDFEKILENAAGGTVIIELSGEKVSAGQFAHAYEQVVEFVSETVKRYQRNTLCIFIELADKPGFAPQLIARLQDDLHIIELHEGAGNRETALSYLKDLLSDADSATLYTDAELLEAMGDKLTFSASDIFNVREKLFNSSLKNKTYPAYREVDRLSVKSEEKSNDAYADFQEMIGLTEQKALIEQIIAAHRVQKMRMDMNLDKQKTALHMCFTGTPGTAKTTVARLISQILGRDGVLKTGRFVECGRADLVAKYVGWTAKAVRTKFREARGGVLFIDEAYSLSDGEHATFGDEAINTIVQEMENHRDDVIVIFAGYPDKMKDFLDRNEGLRSRIAFHINFPDYTAEELTDIFKLMAKRRGFNISDEISEHCKKIFKRVAKKKNFGNGRFVRTLLEQAWLKQAQRIIKENEGGTVTKEDLTSFKVEDFDVNVDKKYLNERKLGFIR
ncbi:MAG: AAA family ATPase [Selenomonadaceae bacterium]|nr:AAA family ATPase [Selenomonadaceae bacterium]MBQ7493420.1 AAA family ATPase [Selenomonadaceae bacterium]